MNLKSISRSLLYFTFFYNIFGFVSFAFPETLGKMSGLPVPSQLMYSSFGAGQILLWAFVYLFLARQEPFNRPLLLVGALGKFVLFSALLISWQHGEIATKTVLFGLVDVFMGAVWTTYLLKTRSN